MSTNEKYVGLTTVDQPEKITNRDLWSTWIHWNMFSEVSHSYERLQTLAYCYTMIPILKKLFPARKEEFNIALQRHLEFFNSQAVWGGGTILGITIALEEERAKAIAEGRGTVLDPSIIVSTKVGLMGPFAGIGDSIDWGVLLYMLIAIALPWAQNGQWIGAIFPWVMFTILPYAYGFYFLKTGYRLGREAATAILGSGTIHQIIVGAGILGLFMMGAMAATYITVSSPLTWTISGKAFSLQSTLDSVLPGILPFTTVMLAYIYFLRNGMKVNRLLLYMVIIFFVLGLIGVL